MLMPLWRPFFECVWIGNTTQFTLRKITKTKKNEPTQFEGNDPLALIFLWNAGVGKCWWIKDVFCVFYNRKKMVNGHRIIRGRHSPRVCVFLMIKEPEATPKVWMPREGVRCDLWFCRARWLQHTAGLVGWPYFGEAGHLRVRCSWVKMYISASRTSPSPGDSCQFVRNTFDLAGLYVTSQNAQQQPYQHYEHVFWQFTSKMQKKITHTWPQKRNQWKTDWPTCLAKEAYPADNEEAWWKHTQTHQNTKKAFFTRERWLIFLEDGRWLLNGVVIPCLSFAVFPIYGCPRGHRGGAEPPTSQGSNTWEKKKPQLGRWKKHEFAQTKRTRVFENKTLSFVSETRWVENKIPWRN